MSLTLTDVHRIVADVAREKDPPLEVVAAIPADGGSMYTEVVLTVPGCQVEPCRLIVGVSRNMSEPECRRAVKERLEQQQ